MATNLSGLSNISPLNISTTGLESPSTVVPAILSKVQSVISNFWFHSSLWTLFFFLFWGLTQKEGSFRLSPPRALVATSCICLNMGAVFLISTIVSTVFPLFWFGGIWLLTFAWTMSLNARGLR